MVSPVCGDSATRSERPVEGDDSLGGFSQGETPATMASRSSWIPGRNAGTPALSEKIAQDIQHP